MKSVELADYIKENSKATEKINLHQLYNKFTIYFQQVAENISVHIDIKNS